MELVIVYETLQRIISRSLENLQKEMDFENIVCMKLHNVVSSVSLITKPRKLVGKIKAKTLVTKVSALLILRSMQPLVKRRAP